MNRRRLALLWLLSSAALAALTAWGVLRWHVTHEHRAQAADLTDSEERFHAWIHEHLKLTPQQESVLHAAENAFASRRRALRETMQAANAELRAAVLRDRADSPAVRSAVEKLAAAQAALQKATLAHLFDMAGKLDAPQRNQLIQWTHDSLQPAP
jgi:Spy/CpxP family protein refolding chaperone